MDRLRRFWTLSRLWKMLIIIPLVACSITVYPVNADEVTQEPVLRTDYSVSGHQLIWFEKDTAGIKQIHYRNLETGNEKQITDSPTAKDAPYIGGDIIVWADKGTQQPESTYWDIYSYDLRTDRTIKLNVKNAQYAYPSTDGEVVTWYDLRNYGDMYFYVFNHSSWPSFTDQSLGEGKYPIVGNGKVVYKNARDGGLSVLRLSSNYKQYLVALGGNNYVDWFTFNGHYVLLKQVNGKGESKYVSIDLNNLSIEPNDITEFSKRTVEYSFMAVGKTQGAFVISEGEDAVIKGVDLATSAVYTVELPSDRGKLIGFSGDLLLYETTGGALASKDLSNGGQGTTPPGDGSGSESGGGNTETPGDGNGSESGGGNTETPGDGNGSESGGGNTETPGDGNGSEPGDGNTETPGGTTTVVPPVVAPIVPNVVEDLSSRNLGASGGEIVYGTDKVEARLDVGKETFAVDSQISLKPQALTDLQLIDAKGRKLEVRSAWLIRSGQDFARDVQLAISYDLTGEWKDAAQKLGIYEYNEKLGYWSYVGGISQDGQGMIATAIQKPGIYAVMLRNVQFQDVSQHWSAHAVEVLASRGIVDGVEGNLFAPSSTLKRGEFIKLLVSALQLKADQTKAKSYADVSNEAWYADAIWTASAAGIVKGTAGSFNPDEEITREQMITMLIRAVEYSGHKLESGSVASLSEFKDVESISKWAEMYVSKAIDWKFIEGNGNSLNPLGTTTRAEGAMVLYRMLNQLGLL